MEAANKRENSVVALWQGNQPPATLENLSPQDTNLFFVNELRRRLQNVMASRPSPAESALCVLSMLQQLVVRDARDVRFEEGLESLMQTLVAEPVVIRTFQFLYKQAREVLNALVSKFDVSTEIASELLLELAALIDWYGERWQSLVRIGSVETLNLRGNEGIFHIAVIHDVERHGIPGLIVETGIKLDSRHGETLWQKVNLLYRGRPLTIADGWESWTDENMEEDDKANHDTGSFCVTAPLVCYSSRKVGPLIVDSQQLFIPYAALSWPEDVIGRTAEVTVAISVTDGDGEKLFSQSQIEDVRVWSARGVGTFTIPSPQSIEMWDMCPLRKFSLSNISMTTGQEKNVSNIYLSFDSKVTGLLGREITVELRVIDQDHNLVQSTNTESSDGQGYFRQELILAPSRAFSKFESVSFVINPRDLDLKIGNSNLVFEISVLDDMRKVLCGVVEPFSVRLH